MWTPDEPKRWAIFVMAFGFVVRDILRSKGLSLFFILNLAVGLLGFVLIESFRDAVDRRLTQNSQEVLGADLSISGRRPLTEEELKALEEPTKSIPSTEQVELYSMVTVGASTRLAQIKSLGSDFPFYGSFQIRTDSGVSPLSGRDLKEGHVWVYPELRDQLGLRLGEVVRIGDRDFVIAGWVEDDVGSVWGSFSLAPRVFISHGDVSGTKLLSEGSLATYFRLFKTPAGLDSDELANRLSDLLNDPGIRVISHRRAAEQAGRFLQYFADYLGLIAVVGLILAALGLSYLARMFIQSKLREIAILQALGMTPGRVLLFVLLHLMTLGLLASALVLATALPLFGSVESWVQSAIQMDLDLRITWTLVVSTVLLSTLALLLILAPEIQRIRNVEPSSLFREFAKGELETAAKWYWRLPAFFVLCVLSVLQSHSLKVGLGFSLGILAIAAVISLATRLGFRLLARIPVRGMGWRFSVRSLARGGVGSATALLTLALGSLILVLMPQLRSSLTSEIQRPSSGALPSLFMFDIQPEQVQDLKDFARQRNITLQSVSPLVRARLESINGKEFEKSNVNDSRFFREEEQADRTRNRTYNLSYRAEPLASEEIISGTYTGTWESTETPPISVEERFADRLGVKIGDVLRFDVQGVFIEGRITSLRRVRWTSFQPNFFIQFPDGVLNEAPQVYLAAAPPMLAQEKAGFQLGIVERFSNVSIIDVDRTLEKLLRVVDLIGIVLNAMAILSILVGFFVLAAILADQLSRRERDVVLLKLLGADFLVIKRSLVLEYRILGFAGGLFGAIFGMGMAFALTIFVFDGVWQADYWAVALVIGLLLLISEILARLFVERTLSRTRSTSAFH